uniref:Amino acid transporter n=1 Tax=Meloidogyne javanica TaxID=6303 RepID=A0A915N2E0_MELJA
MTNNHSQIIRRITRRSNIRRVFQRLIKIFKTHLLLSLTISSVFVGLIIGFAFRGMNLNQESVRLINFPAQMDAKESGQMSLFTVGYYAVIMQLVGIFMWLTPLGIVSLISGNLLELTNLSDTAAILLLYVFTVLSSLFIHTFLTMPLIYFLFTRKNPLKVAKGMLQALVTAFGTASGGAALDGNALYEAVAVIFIAQLNNVTLTLTEVITVSFIATIASLGLNSVPAGLVSIFVILSTVGLPVKDIPLVITADWLLDRIRTSINVLGDAFVASTVNLITPDTFTWRMSKMHLRSNGNFEARLNGALLLPSVPIQGQFESLLGHLSLSISVKMFSQGTIMIKSFGEISFNGIGETPFFAPNVLIPQPQGVHMAEFFGTDYIANSMLYHAYKQKYMDIIVGPESSPRLKDILKTTCQTGFCIGEYLGSLGHQFPDREVEIHYSAKKAPIMVFVEGKARFRLHGKMDLFVRPKNITQQKEQILRSETTLTSNVNLWIEKTQILGNASVENLDFRLIEANIHDVDQNTFGDLGLFGAEFLEKLLTEILQMGLILPSMKGVVLRSPKLSIHERYVKVQTYFKLDELYAKRLVQGAVRQTLLNIGR